MGARFTEQDLERMGLKKVNQDTYLIPKKQVTEVKKNKYGNIKVEHNGIKADSKLEMMAYNLLKANNFEFDFQVTIELLPKHVNWNKKKIRATEMIVDFVIYLNGVNIYLDTKGFATSESKIKYKWLSYKLIESGEKHRIEWKKTRLEVEGFILELINLRDGKH